MSDSIDTIDWIAASPAAARALMSRDDITLDRLSDEAVRITIKARPREVMNLVITTAAFGVGAVACGFLFERHRWFYDVPLKTAQHPLPLFGGLGALLIGVSAMVLLFTVVNGPERDTVLEVSPGRVRIDRYVAGDHVVRDYLADEVSWIGVEAGAITLSARRDVFSLAPFAAKEIRVPIVTLVAQGLWLDDAGIGKSGGRVVARRIKED